MHMQHGVPLTYISQPERSKVVELRAGAPDGEHFGVRGRIVGRQDLVVALADDLAVLDDDGAVGAAEARRAFRAATAR